MPMARSPGHRPATRPQGEARLAECPPDAGRRDTRAAASAARTGAVLARLYDRAARADDAQGLPCAIRSNRGSGQDAIPDTSAHAAAWLRLCPSHCSIIWKRTGALNETRVPHKTGDASTGTGDGRERYGRD